MAPKVVAKNASARKLLVRNHKLPKGIKTERKSVKDLLQKNVPKRWESKMFTVRKGARGDVYVLKKLFVQNKYLSLWRKHSPLARTGSLSGKRVLDLGANIGAFSARVIAEGAEVVAVEPDNENFALLLKNVEAAAVLRGAVIATGEKSVQMFSKPKEGQSNRNSVIKDHVNSVACGSQVPTLRLETLLKDHGPFDLVKVDIEGAEVSVFQKLPAKAQCFKGVELLVYFHVDKFPLVKVFHGLIKKLRSIFSIVELERVVGPTEMLDEDWEQKVVRNPGLKFRKALGFAGAKKDILIYCGHRA